MNDSANPLIAKEFLLMGFCGASKGWFRETERTVHCGRRGCIFRCRVGEVFVNETGRASTTPQWSLSRREAVNVPDFGPEV